MFRQAPPRAENQVRDGSMAELEPAKRNGTVSGSSTAEDGRNGGTRELPSWKGGKAREKGSQRRLNPFEKGGNRPQVFQIHRIFLIESCLDKEIEEGLGVGWKTEGGLNPVTPADFLNGADNPARWEKRFRRRRGGTRLPRVEKEQSEPREKDARQSHWAKDSRDTGKAYQLPT